MNKYVVISTNDNEDYFHYLPIVTHAWNQLGWAVICFYRGERKKISYFDKPNMLIEINKTSQYREATIVQVSRLFAGYLDLNESDYILTSDVDMLPCSNYWSPNQDEITIYGYDLTDFTEFPICYIGMNLSKWRRVMSVNKDKNVCDAIFNFLDNVPNAKSNDFYQWWGVDQQEITKLLKQESVVHIRRNKLGDYALGRVDRGNWNLTLNQLNLIDAHLPRPAKNELSKNQVRELLIKVNLLPNWYNTYCYE